MPQTTLNDLANIIAGNIAASEDVRNCFIEIRDAINSLDSDNFSDGSISGSKIQNNSLNGTKIIDDSITGAKIADGEITNDHIATDSIPITKLQDVEIAGTPQELP